MPQTPEQLKSTKPSAATCTASGHDISHNFNNVKGDRVEVDCWCWTCTYHWIERWTLERVEVGK